MGVDMAQLLPAVPVPRHSNKVRGVGLAQQLQGLVDLVQLDGAVGVQVAALRVALGEVGVAAGEQGLGAVVVARGEVHLGQPECVLVVA